MNEGLQRQAGRHHAKGVDATRQARAAEGVEHLGGRMLTRLGGLQQHRQVTCQQPGLNPFCAQHQVQRHDVAAPSQMEFGGISR